MVEDNNNVEEQSFVWTPKTSLGKEVLTGRYSSLSEVLLSGRRILEPEIVDYLQPDMKSELVNIGQSKGKFGGGKRKSSKNTQKKTKEGSKLSFAVMAVVGNGNGVVGVGVGKAAEIVPAREKALTNAKKNVCVIRRGCGDWGCFCGTPHTIPFSVEGKCGSSVVRLMPAPRGVGLVVDDELQKVLSLAGIKDVWSKTFGQAKNKVNFVSACLEALRNLENVRLTPYVVEGRGIKEGEKNE